MAARTLGWAQRYVGRTGATFNQNAIGAVVGTAQDPIPGAQTVALIDATNKPFEVQAGVPVTIRWAAATNNADALGWDLVTNTTTFNLKAFYETSQTAFLAAGALLDTFSWVGTAGVGVRPFDRTVTFTPTVTGTVRLYVEAITVVTIGGAAFSNCNTDGGNFGSPAENLTATGIDMGFTPGLMRVGTTLNSLAITGLSASPNGYFPDTATATFVTGHAPRVADGTYSLDWRDATPTTFATTTIASGTSTSLASSRQIAPSTLFPAANTAVTLRLTPSNSALSTALGGAALPWVHFSSLPAGLTGTSDAAGNKVDASKAAAFNADPRLQLHAHAQKSPSWPTSPPDAGAPAPFDTYVDDFYLYIISADLWYGWFAAFNMNGVGQNGITGSMHLTDPTVPTPTSGGGGDHTSSLVTTTVGGNPLGWSRQSTPATFTPAPPAGQWHWWCESATDGTNVWSRLNGYAVYKQGNADAFAPYALFASGMNFVSAYRDNLYLETGWVMSTGGPNETRWPKPGDTVLVACRALKDNSGDGIFVPYQFDLGTVPKIKIFSFDQTTFLPVYAVGSATAMVDMTVDPADSSIYFYLWDTTGFLDNPYLALISAHIDGGAKLNQTLIFLGYNQPRDLFEPTGLFK